MFSTSTSISDMATRQSNSIRRRAWKMPPPPPPPSTPLRQRKKTTGKENEPPTPIPTLAVSTPLKREQSTSTGKESSFLPEFHSTPPMPSFQKPLPTISPRRRVDLRPTTSTSTPLRSVQKSARLHRQFADNSPTFPSSPPLAPQPPTPSYPHLASLTLSYHPVNNDNTNIPPLPSNWTSTHDRAICVLDARDYPLPAIVAKIRRAFAFRGSLTAAMVDRRLRQLDADVECVYWRVGLGLPVMGEEVS